jgi:hypothetical protein
VSHEYFSVSHTLGAAQMKRIQEFYRNNSAGTNDTCLVVNSKLFHKITAMGVLTDKNNLPHINNNLKNYN